MLNRTEAPPFTRSTTYSLLSPEVVTLPNGASLYLLAGGSQPVVKVELLLNAGRWMEEHRGAAYFTAQLLSKGTSSKNSFTIAQLLDQYGAHLEVSPGLDVLSVSLYALSKTLKPALELLVELLTDSIFPQKELDLIKSIYLQNLKVNNEKTSFLASKLIRNKLFGPQHPYGVELEEADIVTLQRDNIVSHFQTFGHDIQMVVAGDIGEANKQALTDFLNQLTVKVSGSKAYTYSSAQPVRTVQEKEGSVQTTIRMGKHVIGRLHPDYPALVLLNHILGGYFGSRLMKNIREEKGLTYGIYSSVHALKYDSYLVIGADVNKENTAVTFTEIQKELVQLGTTLIGNDELETARNHFIGSLQSELTTAFAHADKYKSILLYGLPFEYYQSLIRSVDILTVDQLLQTGKQYFAPEQFIEVAVG